MLDLGAQKILAPTLKAPATAKMQARDEYVPFLVFKLSPNLYIDHTEGKNIKEISFK